MGPMILSFFISGCVGIPLGIFICLTLYNKIKHEECREKGQVLQHIIKTYAIIQCITWPLLLCLFGIATLLISNSSMYKLIVVIITRFLYIFIRSYTGFNSLIIAICKYFFVVLEPMADTHDIQRTKRALVLSSFLVPILFSILHEATIVRADFWDQLFGILNCNVGITNDSYFNDNYTWNNKTNMTLQSPLFTLFNIYCSPQWMNALNVICIIMFIMMRSNLVEGFIYLHIFIHDRR